MPSSLTRVFPRTLGFSPRLPVSVLVRAMCLYLEAFLDSVGSITSLLSLVTRHHISAFRATDLPIAQPTCLNTLFQSRADLPYCVTPSIKRFTPVQEFQPVVHRLRFSASASVPTYPETTIVAQEPLGFRWNGFSPFFSLLIPTFSLLISPQLLTVLLQPDENAPLPIYIAAYDTTSVLHFSPGHFRRRVSRPVSYYALFKWWLLLSQHPGCFGNSTSFAT